MDSQIQEVPGINFEFPEFHALETGDINTTVADIHGGYKSAGITPAPLESSFVENFKTQWILRIQVRGINFEFPEFHALETPDINTTVADIHGGYKSAGITPAPLESSFVENFKTQWILRIQVRGINFEFPEFHALVTGDINTPLADIHGGHKSAGITPASLESSFVENFKTQWILRFRFQESILNFQSSTR
ncbi:hypothetical protein Fcan01_11313 [Folsomia candida]|uniref:Uncharacterized protein n=1 Tax=Folsomia candida TaxID=158441 RepID=A0A226ECQ2_FOLCA|nr:hypothetical protein Fcan01_11313 [Folsomia candida]